MQREIKVEGGQWLQLKRENLLLTILSIEKHLRSENKRKWESISETSLPSNTRRYSLSSSPKFKRKKIRKTIRDNSDNISTEENKLYNKNDYFKSEFKKAQVEILELREQLGNAKNAFEMKDKEIEELRKELESYKKRQKHYKYYKEKGREYKEKLKKASKEIQSLEIENNSNLPYLII